MGQKAESETLVVELHIAFAPIPLWKWRDMSKNLYRNLVKLGVEIDEWEISCYRPKGDENA